MTARENRWAAQDRLQKDGKGRGAKSGVLVTALITASSRAICHIPARVPPQSHEAALMGHASLQEVPKHLALIRRLMTTAHVATGPVMLSEKAISSPFVNGGHRAF